MGWMGTAILAAVIGIAGWRFHPSAPARTRRGGRVPAAVVAVIAALGIKLAGNASGAFSDGQSLEWLATMFAAIVAVAILGRFYGRSRA